MNKAEEALKLWEEWLANNNMVDAPLAYEAQGDSYCFFCNRSNPLREGHEPNCIYIRAKELVKGPLFKGLNIPE